MCRRRQSYKTASLAERNHSSETGRNNSHVHSTEQDRKRWKETSLGPAEEPSKKIVSGQFLLPFPGGGGYEDEIKDPTA